MNRQLVSTSISGVFLHTRMASNRYSLRLVKRDIIARFDLISVSLVPDSMIAVGLLEPDCLPSLFPAGELAGLGIDLRCISLSDTVESEVALDRDAEIRLVILQQVRRRPYSNSCLQVLRRRFPFALFVCVNGRWNEGAARSGKPYSGVLHVRDSEAVYRIRRLISCMNRQTTTMGEYRPLFSPREALWWWLDVGISEWVGNPVSLLIFGQRSSTGGIAKAFESYGWVPSEYPLEKLISVSPDRSGLPFHEQNRQIAIVRNRAEVRWLLLHKLVSGLDLLIADNLTVNERRSLKVDYACAVISKPYQNDDLVEAMQVRSPSPGGPQVSSLRE